MSSDGQKHVKPYDLAEIAYREVLDATKHQDDKIGRVVAALAFLTSAATALFFATGTAAVKFSFDSRGLPEVSQGTYPLVAWAAYGFFICILGSVVLLLLSLAVPLRLPNSSLGSMFGSRIFFTYIAEEDRDDWVRRWSEEGRDVIERELSDNFARESHNLAERAKTKYRHTSEAVSLFVLGLLFLTMSVVLAIGAPSDGQVAAQWGWKFQFGLAVLIALQGSLQLYAAYVDASVSVRTRRAALEGSRSSLRKRAEARTYLYLTVLVPVFVACCLLPGSELWQRWAGILILVTAVSTCYLFCLGRWNPADLSDQDQTERQREDWLQAKAWLISAVVCTSVAVTAIAFGGVFQLGAALIPSVLICLQVISTPVRKHRRLMMKVDLNHAAAASKRSRRSNMCRELKVVSGVMRALWRGKSS